MVIALVTVTLNGKIATSTDDQITWHSEQDIKLFVQDTKDSGVVVMGRTTYEQIAKRGRTLPGRHKIVMTSSPDQYEKADELEFTDETPKEIISRLSEKYADICIIGGGQIYTQFLEAGLIDEIRVTIAPFVFGKGAVNFINDSLSKTVQLTMKSQKTLDDNFIRVIYSMKYGN